MIGKSFETGMVSSEFCALSNNTKFKEKKFIQRRHFPKSVMVWAGISKTGKTPLVFVEQGVKINAQIYQEEILRKIVLPWFQKHFQNRQWTFQQDWAPAHSAGSTMEFCNQNFPKTWGKELWPSNSPDLNPMDYAIWGILEKKACSKSHSSIEQLKKSLTRAWAEIPTRTLLTTVKNFRKRLEACVAAEGGHFEQKLK